MPLIQWPSGRSPVVIDEVQTGVTEGNAETQSPISVPALEQRREGRRRAVGGGLLERVGAKRVDDAEDQLAGAHRSVRRPSYLRAARSRRARPR